MSGYTQITGLFLPGTCSISVREAGLDIGVLVCVLEMFLYHFSI
jgi:hypothetical protein